MKQKAFRQKRQQKNYDANIEIEVGRASQKDVNVAIPNDVSVVSPNDVPKKRYISPEERQNIIHELKSIPKKRCIFLKIIGELRLTSKERYISPEERPQIIDELRLV